MPQQNEMLSLYHTALGFISKKMKNINYKTTYNLKKIKQNSNNNEKLNNVFKREYLALKNLFAFHNYYSYLVTLFHTTSTTNQLTV